MSFCHSEHVVLHVWQGGAHSKGWGVGSALREPRGGHAQNRVLKKEKWLLRGPQAKISDCCLLRVKMPWALREVLMV